MSYKKRLFDYADDRKVHKGAVPRLGGVVFTPCILLSIAAFYALSILLLGSESPAFALTYRMTLGIASLLLIYLEGISDDLLHVHYRVKFLVQFLCAILLALSGIWINNFYGLFGLWEVPAWFGMPFSVFLIVFVINAMNLIDGIDGLSSGIGIIALLFLGCLFVQSGSNASSLISFATVGVLITFFCYNVFGKVERGRKIFMGDCGSQTLGFLLALLVIRYSTLEPEKVMMENPLVASFSLIMIPCFDALRVMIGRMRRGVGPFLPDKTHIHHKLLALGMSQHVALLVILTLVLFFVILNLGLVKVLNVNIILVIDIVLWLLLQEWLTIEIARRKKMDGAQNGEQEN